MNKAYKYRIYPTREQQVQFNKTIGCCRFIYNQMLADSKENYELRKNNPEIEKYKFQIGKYTKDPEFSWLREVDSDSLCYAQQNVTAAYKKFFKERKNGVGFPKFKRKSYQESFKARGRSVKVSENMKWILFPKFKKLGLGWVRIIIHKPFRGIIKSVTVSKTSNGEWYASFSCEMEDEKVIYENTGSIGIDLGLADFAILSDGEKSQKIPNPRFLYRTLAKLEKEQKVMSRRQLQAKKDGKKMYEAKNYQKQRIKVAKIHEKVARQRDYFLNVLSSEIVKNYDVISIEDLKVKELIEKGDKNRARNISDVSWSEFIRKLQYKADWSDRKVIKVDQWFPSSQICSNCGHRDSKKDVSIREWDCPNCGHHHDRDINAATNILIEGIKILQESK